MKTISITTQATVSSKSTVHNPQIFSSSFILLQQSHIVIFIFRHPVVRKVAAISIVTFAERSAGEVVQYAMFIGVVFC